jgi:uncharacterized Tic20 family protein
MTPIPSSSDTSSDERILAALAHGSVILFGWGVFAPAIIWIVQRRKSAFVAFHALQALAYQLGIMVYSLVVSLVMAVALTLLTLVIVLLAGSADSQTMPAWIFGLQFLIFAAIMGAFGLYIGLGLVGGIMILARKDFRYPLFGGWMQRYFEQDGEEPLAAALCHASALIPLMGLFVPLATWISQREHSPRLGFQSLQALIYQLCGLVGYFILMGCQFASTILFFPMVLVSSTVSSSTHPQSSGWAVIVLILFFVIILIYMGISLAQLILGPIYILVALWAGRRVLQGRDYHYPILGNLVARKTVPNQGSQPVIIQP